MLAAIALLLAQVSGSAPLPVVEETVVVEGTRLDQATTSLPSRVVVVTREDLDRMAGATLDDALRHVPGFSPFRRATSLTSHPTTQGVSLRGLGGTATSRTLVLFDDRPLNDPFASWVAWGRVPVTSIERVEIVPAGVATAWGNLALAGAINIVTRRDPHADVLVQAGERGTRILDASLLGGGRALFRLGARAAGTDGWAIIRQDQRGPVDESADSASRSLRLGVSVPAGRSTWDLAASGFADDRGNGTPLADNSTRLSDLGVRWSRSWTDYGTVRIDLARVDETFRSTFSSVAGDRASETPTLDQRVPSSSTALSIGWSSSGTRKNRGWDGSESVNAMVEARRPARWRASAGLDARRTDGATHELFRRMNGEYTRRRNAGGSEDLVGAYGQASLRLGRSERFDLSFGLRADSWRSHGGMRREHDLVTGSLVRDEEQPSRTEHLLSPRLGLLVQSSPRWSARLALSRGFRAPTLNELHRPFRVRDDVTEANPGLVPETATTFEAGIDRHAQRVSLHVTLAQARLDDAIANETVGMGPGMVDPCGFVAAGGTCRVRANASAALVRSLEFAARCRLGSRWRAGLDALMLDARMHSGALRGKRLAQVPRLQANAWIEWSRGRGSVALELRHVGLAHEDDMNSIPLRSGTVVDASWRRSLAGRWDVGVSAQNLLDDRLESGRTADGLVNVAGPRLVLASLRWRR